MNRTGRVVSTATALGIAGALAEVARRQLADPAIRLRVQRSSRIWRLTARNGVRFAAHKVRGAGADEARRAELDERFALRTATDVANELGQMKGALMKAGQLISFIVEALPEEAQQALSSLYADAPPMSPTLAEGVVRDQLGDDPEHVFLDWAREPVAAASVGQVHRAVTRDGRDVAVKVQYPGVGDAIIADLSNAERMYALLSAFALKGLDTQSLVDELRDRMVEELDYRLEAANTTEFAAAFAGHPVVRIPRVVPEHSAERVLTTEWVSGMSWNAMMAATADDPVGRQQIGEIVWRFAQHAIHRLGRFNGDPHPGNYLFMRDEPGSHRHHLWHRDHGGVADVEGAVSPYTVTFLDFGLVKRWSPGEWDVLSPCLDAIILHRDPERTVAAMEESGFIAPGLGLDPQVVYDYVSAPYLPYLTDSFTFSRDFMRDTVGRVFDMSGPYGDVAGAMNLPSSFIVLNRVAWGVSALLGKLEVTAPWRAMLFEYTVPGSPPATPLGEAEMRWWHDRNAARA